MIFQRKNVVTEALVRSAITECGLGGRPVCIHASLRSFGRVKDGPATIINAFLDEGCTVVVPTFSWCFLAPKPSDVSYAQNGNYYMGVNVPQSFLSHGYHPARNDLDLKNMGIIPKFVLSQPERIRSSHPLCSFAALGPLAEELMQGQGFMDVYAPFEKLADMGGAVVLMGVGYSKCTLLHNAEKKAGIRLMRRWAYVGDDKQVVETENGSCSSGFMKFEPILRGIRTTLMVGDSFWRVHPAAHMVDFATAAIEADISIRHCGLSYCDNCNQLSLGGPIVS